MAEQEPLDELEYLMAGGMSREAAEQCLAHVKYTASLVTQDEIDRELARIARDRAAEQPTEDGR